LHPGYQKQSKPRPGAGFSPFKIDSFSPLSNWGLKEGSQGQLAYSGVVIAVPQDVSAQDATKKASEPQKVEGMTKEQADAILDELKQIRLLLKVNNIQLQVIQERGRVRPSRNPVVQSIKAARRERALLRSLEETSNRPPPSRR